MLAWLVGRPRLHLLPQADYSAGAISKFLLCRSIVLQASRFRHILYQGGLTREAYRGNSLAELSNAKRGVVLQNLARTIHGQLSPGSDIQDALPGLEINGNPRTRWNAEYDWTCDGKRVECKSAQLCFVRSYQTWAARFKFKKWYLQHAQDSVPFDDLFLVLFTPEALYFLRYDIVRGICLLTGAKDHYMTFRGRRGNHCWRASLSDILSNLDHPSSNCLLLHTLAVNDPLVTQTMSELFCCKVKTLAYTKAPPAMLNSTVRAFRFQTVAFEVDKIMNPDSSFSLAIDELRAHGQRRGNARSKVDWLRDGKGIEFKQTELHWMEKSQNWMCSWQAVEFANGDSRPDNHFEELWLAIYSPMGLHILRHSGTFGISFPSKGSRQWEEGFDIRAYSRTGETSIEAALDTIVSKLLKSGCHLLATVVW